MNGGKNMDDLKEFIINFEEENEMDIFWKELGKLCNAVFQFGRNFDKIYSSLPSYCFETKFKSGNVLDDGLIHNKKELKKIFLDTMKSNFLEKLEEKEKGEKEGIEEKNNKNG